jgi:hypothetical protein
VLKPLFPSEVISILFHGLQWLHAEWQWRRELGGILCMFLGRFVRALSSVDHCLSTGGSFIASGPRLFISDRKYSLLLSSYFIYIYIPTFTSILYNLQSMYFTTSDILVSCN